MPPEDFKLYHRLALSLPIIIMLVLSNNVQAQFESANWFLHDRTGLQFVCDPPRRFESNFDYHRTCSISDSNGEVILYSDSRSIWNSRDEVIENGNISFDQDGSSDPMVIPFPGKELVFLLFKFGGYSRDDLYYSVIDMKAGAGKGAVLEKNVKLTNNLNPNRERFTRFALTGDKGRNVFWLVTALENGSKGGIDYLYFFKITSSGISQPIIFPTPKNGWYIPRFSPNGKKIAFNVFDQLTFHSIDIYDFDFTTGEISNLISIPMHLGGFANMEFSPNGNFLYVGGYQYDLRSNNEQKVVSSVIEIFSDDGLQAMSCYQPQLAIDGKIYFSCDDGPLNNKRKGLWVIPFPNRYGKGCGGWIFFTDFKGTNGPSRPPQYPASFQFNDQDIPLNASLFHTPFLNLNFASVSLNDERKIEVEANVDPRGLYETFLYFQDEPKSIWTKDTSLEPDRNVVEIYFDSVKSSMRFRAAGIDQCGAEIHSNILNTIYLTGSVSHEQGVANLAWGAYEEADAIDRFEIWTGYDSLMGHWKTVDGAGLEHTFSLDSYDVPFSRFRIKAIQKSSTKPLWSNTIELDLNTLFIPNVITPNGDLLNDYFEIKHIDHFPTNQLIIYDRWGKEVYNRQGYDNTWNGNGSIGMFYYLLTVLDNHGEIQSYRGWLNTLTGN